MTTDVHLLAATRGDLHSDPVNLHRPSARTDLQSPLTLTPSSPSSGLDLIDNYYIIGVHLSNSSTSSNYDIYIYLPDDYDSDNDLYSLINDQLKIMETAGYPASLADIESVTITADTRTHTPHIPELDDETIHS